jgi:hypothetical protein
MKSKDTCGPQKSMPWLSKLIPDLVFSEACGFHDRLYAKVKTERERKIADRLFLDALHQKAATYSIPKYYILWTISYMYYWAVRVFGRYFLNKGK